MQTSFLPPDGTEHAYSTKHAYGDFFINAQCLDLMYFLCIQSKNNPEFLSDRYLNGFHPFVRDVMKAKQKIK